MQERLTVMRQRMTQGAAAACQAVTTTHPASAAHAWTSETLGKVVLPSVPAVEPWSLSLAELVGSSEVVPGPAIKVLSLLDSFGCIRVGPTGLGFDGTDVPWGDVREVRVAQLFELLTRTALEKEVERLRRLLPPVPGRKWVVGRALAMFQALVGRAWATSGSGSATAVCTVRYRSRFGRERELHPGIVAVLVLAALPQVNESLIATARSHGVSVSGESAGRLMDPAHEQRLVKDLEAGLDAEISMS